MSTDFVTYMSTPLSTTCSASTSYPTITITNLCSVTTSKVYYTVSQPLKNIVTLFLERTASPIESARATATRLPQATGYKIRDIRTMTCFKRVESLVYI